MTWDEHFKNRGELPLAERERYYGKHVAWNMDGTQIVASGEDDFEVFQALKRAGYNTEQVVFTYIPLPDEVMMGGAFGPDEENAS